MAKNAKQTLQAVGESPFWKGENPGDSLKGKFDCWQNTQYGLAMTVDLGHGKKKLIGMSAVLWNLMKGRENLKKGTNVEFTYVRNAKKTRIYSAMIGKEVLDAASSFPAATADEIKAAFSGENPYLKANKKAKAKKGKK